MNNYKQIEKICDEEFKERYWDFIKKNKRQGF